MQRLARLNGKALYQDDPATGARVIPVKLILCGMPKQNGTGTGLSRATRTAR